MGSEKSGKKNDFQDGKLRWDLLPLEEIEDIVKLYTAGSIKYGDNNWQGLENGYQRYKAAMLRHLLEYEKGNKIDAVAAMLLFEVDGQHFTDAQTLGNRCHQMDAGGGDHQQPVTGGAVAGQALAGIAVNQWLDHLFNKGADHMGDSCRAADQW